MFNCIFAAYLRIMEMENNQDDFYKKLKERLSDTSLWPTTYLFKFIVPTDRKKIKAIAAIFDNMGAVIDTKASRKGTYTSVSINVRMKDPDAVIKKYKEAGVIEGVISL